MRRNKIYLILLLLLWMSSSYGQATVDQRVVLPSPNSSALIRLANTAVHEFSGTAAVSIPLASLPAKSINIPVSLNYLATGIKVQQASTSVGLGWNLSAGGRITRVINGMPDGEVSSCGDPLVPISTTIRSAALEDCDPEMDLYYYNFLGVVGKFYVNPDDDQVIPVPMNDMVFEYDENDQEFIITNESGFKFYFGRESQNIEVTTLSRSEEKVSTSGYRVGPQRSSDPNRYEEEYTYNSSWLIYKIISPQARQIAAFSYESSNIELIYYGEKLVEPAGTTDSDQYQIDNKLEVSQKYISEINTEFGSILFTYSGSRKDLFGGKRLDYLSIQDDSNSETSRTELGYKYVDKYRYYEFGGTPPQPCNSDYDCNRLLLKSITENDLVTYELDYIDEDEFNFPRRYDVFMDHWGFFNYSSGYGSGHNGWRSAIPDISFPGGGGLSPVYISGSRKTRHSSGHILTLEKINNMAGGYQRFEYESHSSGIGGPRLKKIWLSDGSTEWEHLRYSYSNPFSYGTPVYNYESDNGYQVVIKSASLNTLFDINGSAITYGEVVTTQADGSSIRTIYSNSERPDDDPTNSKVFLANGYLTSVESSDLDVNGIPFTNKTSKFWERGIVRERHYIDAGNNIVKRLVNDVDYAKPILYNIPNWTLDLHKVPNPIFDLVYIGQYNVISKYINTRERRVYEYDQDSPSKEMLLTTEYHYHTSYPSLIDYEVEIFQDGSEVRTNYKYIFEYNNLLPGSSDVRTEALRVLHIRNVRNIPIEIVRYYRKNSGDTFKVIEAKLFTYKGSLPFEEYDLRLTNPTSSFTESFVRSSDLQFVKDSRYKIIKTYTFDAATDNLLSVEDESGLVRDYTYNSSDYLTSATLNPGGNSQTTTYTHKKLVGITRVTDLNTNNQDFEYDSKNRLKLLRDRDGNIVERYRYNYSDIVEHNAEFTWSGTARVGNPLTFTVLSEPASIGQTKYYWDFGEGTVVETTSTSTNHTYSSSGSQTVTLVAVNPEFGSATTSLPITISPQPPISASPSSLSFAYTSGSKNVSLSNVIGTPTVTDNRSWISVSNVSSSSITVNCTSNSGSENSRTGTVTVSDSNSTKFITVTQDADPTESICPPGCRWVAATSQCISDTTGLECPQ